MSMPVRRVIRLRENPFSICYLNLHGCKFGIASGAAIVSSLYTVHVALSNI